MGLKRWARQAICALSILSLSVGPVGAQPAAPEPPAELAARQARLAEAMQLVAGAIDRRQFDLAALSASLSSADAAEIAVELRARVATRIYAGVLLGAEGALAAGAANAWDQALLMQSLLGAAGYETRLTEAELSEAEAARLVQASAPLRRGSALADPEAAANGVEMLISLAGPGPEAEGFLASLRDGFATPQTPPDVAAAAEALARQLGPLMPDGAALDRRLTEEARRYLWVQSRRPGEADWQDHHLAFDPLSPPEPLRLHEGALPEEAHHRLEIGLGMEVTTGGEVPEIQPLMAPQTRPLGASPRLGVSIAILPDTMTAEGAGDVSKAEWFVPVVGEALPEGAKAFAMDGRQAPPGAATGGAGALGARLAGTLGGLSSSIGGLGGEPAPEKRTSGVILELVLHPPFGGAPLRTARRIYDPVAMPGISPAGLYVVTAFGGGVGAGELHHAQARQILHMLEGAPPDPANPAALAAAAWIFATAAAAAGEGDEALIWRSRPFTAVTGLQLAEAGGLATSFDIVETGLRALRREAGDWRADPALAMHAGISETQQETALAGAPPQFASLDPVSAWELLAAAQQLQPVTAPARLEALALAPTALFAAQGDLARGAILAVTPGEQTAWWRIDSETGAATGVDQMGRGGVVDFLIQLDITLSSIFLLKGTLECLSSRDPYCAHKNLAWSVLSFAGFAYLGFGAGKVLKLGDVRGIETAVDATVGGFFLLHSTMLSLTDWNPL